MLELYVRGENERAEKILRDGKAAPLKRLRRYFEELIAVYWPTRGVFVDGSVPLVSPIWLYPLIAVS